MKCVYCNSERIVKNGKSNQRKQRYLCKECGRIFVENPERKHYPDNLKKIAIRLYTDGVEISVISRSLEVPYETVRSWIRAEGEKAIKKIEARKKIVQDKVFEKAGLDEMWFSPQIKDLWTYIGKRENDIWIWTAVFDKDFKFFEIGKRDENTFWNFYYQIPLAKEFQTDGYKVYRNLENQEVKKYGYTNWNEGLHSFLRSKLAMLKRKTKAYAKSFRALYRALALVFVRWNLLSTF